MNIKKAPTTVIVMAIVLVVMLVSGCAKNEPDNSGSSNAATSSPAASNGNNAGEEPESNEVVIWYSDPNIWSKTIPEFNEQFPDVKISYVNVQWKDYLVKYMTAKATNQGMPDIVFFDQSFARRLMDLDGAWELLNKPPYNINPGDFSDFYVNRLLNKNGDLVAVTGEVTIGGIAYRRDLAKQYLGTDVPEELEKMFPDWDSIVAKGLEVYNKSDGKVFMLGSPGEAFSMLELQSSNQIFDQDGNYDLEVIRPEMEMTKKMLDNKVFDNKVATWSPEWFTGIDQGASIFYQSASWFGYGVAEPFDKDGSGKWGIIKTPGGGAFVQGGAPIGISSSSKSKKAAWEFIKFAYLSKRGAELERDNHFAITPYKPNYSLDFYTGKMLPEKLAFWGGQDVLAKYAEFLNGPVKMRELTRFDSIYQKAGEGGVGLKTIVEGGSVDAALEAMKKEMDDKLAQFYD